MFQTLDDLKPPSPRYVYGKIGSLPGSIRNELNRRIRANQFGTRLVDWLNRLPEVRAILDCRFGGRPINRVNLTKWKATGYRQWRFDQKVQKAFERLASLPDEELAHDNQINPPPPN
jgi:hypothetical protein